MNLAAQQILPWSPVIIRMESLHFPMNYCKQQKMKNGYRIKILSYVKLLIDINIVARIMFSFRKKRNQSLKCLRLLNYIYSVLDKSYCCYLAEPLKRCL